MEMGWAAWVVWPTIFLLEHPVVLALAGTYVIASVLYTTHRIVRRIYKGPE